MSRIEEKFKELSQINKKAFIAFITAGFPNLEVSRELVLELERNGVDIIELGVPFSDPLADGPVIQESSYLSLSAGTNLKSILAMVKSLRKQTQIPLCLLTYYNPIFCFGKIRFLDLAQSCGVDGIIIPDLPPEEDKEFVGLCRKYNIDTIFFLSPTTDHQRISFINNMSRGFIYYVSLTGVTGERERLPQDLIRNLRMIKQRTSKPICVGFGVSCPGQIKAIYQIADGAIVGSAIIRKIKANLNRPDLVKRVGRFVKYLANVK